MPMALENMVSPTIFNLTTHFTSRFRHNKGSTTAVDISVLRVLSLSPSPPIKSNDEVKETCDLKPQRASAKRQKLADKIKSSGSEAKRMAEIQKALAAYKKERSTFSDDSFF